MEKTIKKGFPDIELNKKRRRITSKPKAEIGFIHQLIIYLDNFYTLCLTKYNKDIMLNEILIENKKQQITNWIIKQKDLTKDKEGRYTCDNMSNLNQHFNEKLSLDEFENLFGYSVIIHLQKFTKKINCENSIIFKFISFLKTDFKQINILENSPLGELKRDLLVEYIIKPNDLSPYSIMEESVCKDFFDEIKKNKCNKRQIDKPFTYKNFLSRNFLINLIVTKPILTLYKTILRLQNIEVAYEDLKSELLQFLKTVKIYVMQLGNYNYGMTINTGNIYINKYNFIYCFEQYSHFAVILITLMHEVMHCLIRIFRENKNYYLLTEGIYVHDGEIEYNNENNKIEISIPIKRIEDSGYMFEYYLLGNFNLYHYYLGKFLINKSNYDCDYETFKEKLLKEIEKNDNKVTNDKFLCKKHSYQCCRGRCLTLLK